MMVGIDRGIYGIQRILAVGGVRATESHSWIFLVRHHDNIIFLPNDSSAGTVPHRTGWIDCYEAARVTNTGLLSVRHSVDGPSGAPVSVPALERVKIRLHCTAPNNTWIILQTGDPFRYIPPETQRCLKLNVEQQRSAAWHCWHYQIFRVADIVVVDPIR